jgi:hypothetical protein
MGQKKTILVDFDGVLHEYKTPWTTSEIISDGPVEGSLEALVELLSCEDFEVNIYSSRSQTIGGISAMQSWLLENGVPDDLVRLLKFPTTKPGAWITIDDRCWTFNGPGTFQTVTDILAFKPWNKK